MGSFLKSFLFSNSSPSQKKKNAPLPPHLSLPHLSTAQSTRPRAPRPGEKGEGRLFSPGEGSQAAPPACRVGELEQTRRPCETNPILSYPIHSIPFYSIPFHSNPPSIHPSIHPTIQSTNQPTKQPTKQATKQAINQSINIKHVM